MESHKWLDERAKKLVTREKFYGEFHNKDPDIAWFRERTTQIVR